MPSAARRADRHTRCHALLPRELLTDCSRLRRRRSHAGARASARPARMLNHAEQAVAADADEACRQDVLKGSADRTPAWGVPSAPVGCCRSGCASGRRRCVRRRGPGVDRRWRLCVRSVRSSGRPVRSRRAVGGCRRVIRARGRAAVECAAKQRHSASAAASTAAPSRASRRPRRRSCGAPNVDVSGLRAADAGGRQDHDERVGHG